MPHPTRLFRLASAVFLAGGCLAQLAHAASDTARDYPNKPIRFIVPAMAGGASDNVSRAIARKLADAWGQQVIVDNRGGAAGAVAVDLAAKAAADGYTILMLTASHTTDAAVNPTGPYDLTKDFTAISKASSFFYVMYSNPAVKVSSVKELIALAKANPGKLNYGSTGSGGLPHFAWEMFGQMAGIELVHVPYKGGAHAITAALTGDVHVGFGTLMSVRPHLSTGRLRALAITAKNRSLAAPDLPTVAEVGLPGFEVDQWYGVVTRANVSTAVVRKLNAGIVEALRSPDVVQRFTLDGVTPAGSSAQEFGTYIKSEIAKWRKLVVDARLVLK
jgi:tripartite-type tricarboxylate transporter receptor subunit TctC